MKSTVSLVDAGEQLHGERGQPAFGVPVGGGVEVGRAVVAVEVDERVAQRERLGHADERVVDRAGAVRMVACPSTSPVTRAHFTCGRSGRKPVSYMSQRIRRCTGFSPSRTSGSARLTMTDIA